MFHIVKCPSCAGELDLSVPKNIMKCSYCGSTIVMNEAVQNTPPIKTINKKINLTLILITTILSGATVLYFYSANNRPPDAKPIPAIKPTSTVVAVSSKSTVISAPFDRGDKAFMSGIRLSPGLYMNKDKYSSVAGDWYHCHDVINRTKITITPYGELFEISGENLNQRGSEQWKGYGQLCNGEMFVAYYYTNFPEIAYITLNFKKTGSLYATSYEFNGKQRWSGQFSRKDALTTAGAAEGFADKNPGLKPGIYNDKAREKIITGDWYYITEGVSRSKVRIMKKGELFEIESDNLTYQMKGYAQLHDNVLCAMYYYTNLAELCYITFEFASNGKMYARSMDGDGKVRWSGMYER